jgi:hypothetical protein
VRVRYVSASATARLASSAALSGFRVICREPGIVAVDRVDRGWLCPISREFQASVSWPPRVSLQKSEGRTAKSTGTSGRTSGMPGWAHTQRRPRQKHIPRLLDRDAHTRSIAMGLRSISAAKAGRAMQGPTAIPRIRPVDRIGLRHPHRTVPKAQRGAAAQSHHIRAVARR